MTECCVCGEAGTERVTYTLANTEVVVCVSAEWCQIRAAMKTVEIPQTVIRLAD